MTPSSKNIVLASNNQGKITEIQSLLPDDYQIIPQSHFDLIAAEETASTFIENALIKARHAAQQTGLAAIADDSGLVVNTLDGAPGIMSARYAGKNASDQDNIHKLLKMMQSIPSTQRQAYFICIIVMLRTADDPQPIIAQGIWNGNILTEAQGQKGFGYDPIFWIPSEHCSAAQLSPTRKNEISHRAQALHAFTRLLSTI